MAVVLEGSSRQCNGLEGLFVQANVRFVAMLQLGEKKVTVEAAQKSLQIAADAVPACWVTVQGVDPPLLAKLDGRLEVKEEKGAAGNNLDILPSLVRQEVPALGPLSVMILTTEGESGAVAAAIVVNANHAMIDGRSMRMLLENFLRAVDGIDVQPLSRTPSAPVDWTVALKPPSGNEDNPSFLPVLASDPEAVPLTIYQALGLEPTGEAAADVRIDLDSADVKAALTACRNNSATATGLWTASLLRAVAGMHFSKVPDAEQCVASVSILVDLRESLDPNVAGPADIAQALATVTVGSSIAKSSLDSFDILSEAAAMTKDMRLRIQRGEAHRQAMLMGAGKFEEGPPPATIELSNLGIFTIADCSTSLHFSQRFDGYEGISILLHSESESGTMRLLGSLGSGVPSEDASALLASASGLFLSAGR
mmetsp:Transcript_45377/g.82914  ORF Transcript_45377/g.82914 Transcript_45377/m.82914 type:complete len:424 (-) Transcript_45377:103-1374(-)